MTEQRAFEPLHDYHYVAEQSIDLVCYYKENNTKDAVTVVLIQSNSRLWSRSYIRPHMHLRLVGFN